jgi:hypothetical protein
MSQQGPNFPTVGVDAGGGTGGDTWSTPSAIEVDDGSFSAYSITAGSSLTTNILRGTGFGFSIPTFSTINGILLEIKRASQFSFPPQITDNLVLLLKAGVEVGNNEANATPWPVTTLTYISYGGSSNLWGTSWTPADINNANFGADLQGICDNSAGQTGRVDAYRITVYYTLPGTSFSGVIVTDS